MNRASGDNLRATLLGQSPRPPASGGEATRIDTLRAMGVLDSEPDPRFERIVRLAALLYQAPRAAVVLIDEHRLWLKAKIGIDVDEAPRVGSLAETMLEHGRPLFVGDVRDDARFKHLPPESNRGARFFAAAPLITPSGQIVGVVCVADNEPRDPPSESLQAALIDLAALAIEELIRDAEAVAAREQHAIDQERVDLALTAAGMAAYEWNLTIDEVGLGEAVHKLIGLAGEGFVNEDGEALMALIPEDERAVTRASILESLTATGRYRFEHRMVRPDDGRVVWLASAGVLVGGQGETPSRVIGVIQDITERKLAEEQRETLVAELDHRIKNVLAAVQSLAAQSARRASSIEGFMKTFTGRLKSMASAHQLLTATRWRGAGMQNIAAAELGGLAPGQTRWEGPDVVLTPRAANAMSLALHELVTNAVKFGALSSDAGRVDVRWTPTPGGGLELQWVETGGPTVGAPARRGFGSTLLEKVTGRELGGTVKVDYAREGVRARLIAAAGAIATSALELDRREPTPPPTVAGASVGAAYGSAPIRIEGLKVLIVEDALLLALELEAGLTEAGAEIIGAAADLDEAMRMTSLTMDAAVLDANLNGASVTPVADALKARGVPFVFATGYGDNAFTPQGYDAPIIRKPYDVTQIAAALAAVTGRG
jgi:PAS domain S-box-containing protein